MSEVDDADFPASLVDLVVEVVAGAAQEKATDITEHAAAGATSCLRYILDRSESPFEFVSEQVGRRAAMPCPPDKGGIDLGFGDRRDDRCVGRYGHAAWMPNRSTTATEPLSESRGGNPFTALDLRDPLEHTGLFVGIELDRRSVVVLDQCEPCSFRKPGTGSDRTPDHATLRNPHAIHLPDAGRRRHVLSPNTDALLASTDDVARSPGSAPAVPI